MRIEDVQKDACIDCEKHLKKKGVAYESYW